ncbi:unnamed protein product, partial [Brassica rapa subsp. trilocularis]
EWSRLLCGSNISFVSSYDSDLVFLVYFFITTKPLSQPDLVFVSTTVCRLYSNSSRRHHHSLVYKGTGKDKKWCFGFLFLVKKCGGFCC